MKKRLQWKGWILISIIVSLVLLLVLTFPRVTNLFTYNEWIKTVIIGGAMSIISSLIVSLIFTVHSEKQDYIREVEKEINLIFETYFITQDKMIEIIYNPLMSLKAKLLRLRTIHCTKLSLPILKIEYPDFVKYYHTKIRRITNIIDSIKKQEELDKKQVEIAFAYSEIINELLKIQERFYQKYKGAPKKPIKDTLVFKN